EHWTATTARTCRATFQGTHLVFGRDGDRRCDFSCRLRSTAPRRDGEGPYHMEPGALGGMGQPSRDVAGGFEQGTGIRPPAQTDPGQPCRWSRPARTGDRHPPVEFTSGLTRGKVARNFHASSVLSRGCDAGTFPVPLCSATLFSWSKMAVAYG